MKIHLSEMFASSTPMVQWLMICCASIWGLLFSFVIVALAVAVAVVAVAVAVAVGVGVVVAAMVEL